MNDIICFPIANQKDPNELVRLKVKNPFRRMNKRALFVKDLIISFLSGKRTKKAGRECH